MITSRSNQRIKWVRSLQTKRSARASEAKFVIEGNRLLIEALRAHRTLDLLLYTSEWVEQHPDLHNNATGVAMRAELVSEAVLASCSDVESPQGVLAVLPQDSITAHAPVTLSLVLDQIADPGNLGALLRTALAAGVEQVFLTSGSVDVYNPKVIRAAMGAHFRLPISEASIAQILAALGDNPLWGTKAHSGVIYHQVNWHEPVAIAIGSEAHGLDPDLANHVVGQVQIPIHEQSESLNAATAAAVILFEIQRQRGT
jgi:TrmH family RNA methyltransferase